MVNDFLSTAEAGELLSLTRERVQQLIRKGSIEGKKFGGVWLVDKQSVLTYKAKREGKSSIQEKDK